MFYQRGKRANPSKDAKRLADFEKVCELMRKGIPMSKACAALKIDRSSFTKGLDEYQTRAIKELKHSMKGAGILRCRK